MFQLLSGLQPEDIGWPVMRTNRDSPSGRPPTDSPNGELMEAIGAIGDIERVRSRLDAYAKAGADECGIVPVTAEDAGGARLLDALKPG